MKRIAMLFLTALFISGISVISQEVTPGAVVGITSVVPATDEISNTQLETFYGKFLPVFMKEAPSIPFFLMKKIAGKRMGEYAEFYVFESLEARNEWFPEPGVTSDIAKQALSNLDEYWNEYHKTVSSVDYTDYVVLPFKGESMHLKPGNVVVIYECELAPEKGMTFEDLEKLYREEYGPAFTKSFQGVQFCVLKGERGERTGKYTELIVAKSMDEYKKWMTEDGASTEKAKQAYADMGEIQERMGKMYTYFRSNTYIVL